MMKNHHSSNHNNWSTLHSIQAPVATAATSTALEEPTTIHNNDNNTNTAATGNSPTNTAARRHVVASPYASRGRLDATKSTSSSILMKPRPRSLSAGRSKASHDLVQNVYDRLGVVRRPLRAQQPQSEETQQQQYYSYQQPQQPEDEQEEQAVELDPIIGGVPSMTDSESSPQKETSFRSWQPNATRGRTALPDATATTNTTSATPQPQQRPRSLSRGRLAQIWPPPSLSSSALQQQPRALKEPLSPQPRTTNHPHSPLRSSPRGAAAAGYNNNITSQRSWNTPNSAPVARFSPKRSPTYQQHSLPPPPLVTANTNTTSTTTTTEPETTHNTEQAKEEASSAPKSPLSLRERMRAYSGVVGNNTTTTTSTTSTNNKKKTNKNKQQYAANFSVREHPPKINIYDQQQQQDATTTETDQQEEEKKQDDPQDAGFPIATETNTPKPVHAILRNANIQPGNTTPSFKTRPTTTTAVGSQTARSTNGSQERPKSKAIASAFLASIQQSPKPTSSTYSSGAKQQHTAKTMTTNAVPVAEINAPSMDNDDDNDAANGGDGGSIDMSSVSGTEDFGPTRSADFGFSSSNNNNTATRKPSWQDRLRAKQANSMTPTTVTTTTTSNQHNVSPELARFIEERVQSQVEARLGAAMRRWTQQKDQEMARQLQSMQEQIQQLQEALQQQQQR